VREIRPLGLMWRGLETGPVRYGEPRQSSTLLGDERALQERRVANPSWPRVLQAASRGDA
jgi:hypothetical protein